MPSLASGALLARLKAGLSSETRFLGDASELHPLTIRHPRLGQWLIYLWTITPDRSAKGRPAGEYKIQLQFSVGSARAHRIAGASGRSGRYSLKLASDQRTALLGYSPEFGVFVGWEARLYRNFGASPNVQVREDLLEEARSFGWAVAAPRSVEAGPEIRVAFGPASLERYLSASAKADDANLTGAARELYMLSVSPLRSDLLQTPTTSFTAEGSIDDTVAQERQRIATSRLYRDPGFAAAVKVAYGSQCAVCDIQLDIVEAAHILPANEPKSTDDVWNGIALCPAHHKLFDTRAFVIRQNGAVSIDHEYVAFLHEVDRAGGVAILTQVEGRRMRQPTFWSEKSARRAMCEALAYREAIAGY
jgi:putative restriction endonuclease